LEKNLVHPAGITIAAVFALAAANVAIKKKPDDEYSQRN
jgi:hypothetical protein